MTGHLAVLDLRFRGLTPGSCSIFVCEEQPIYRWGWDEPENAMNNGFKATVDIMPGDIVPTLDLRFVHGMTVQIIGRQPRRTLAVFDRVVMFRPVCAVAVTDDEFMRYSPESGVVNLDAAQRAVA